MTDFTLKLGEEGYPELLGLIHDPPPEIYQKGDYRWNGADFRAIAVVGSRKASEYGREAVKRLIEPLARSGVVIVSGLAFGIDSFAHQAALEAGGLTVAVLGTPVDRVYPVVHTGLAQQIIRSGGAIMSEVPSGSRVHKGLFPKRNRIIAGLTQATIVVEAADKSGSLITPRLALEENREVFAVPGPITSDTSVGTNRLIRDGAYPLLEAQDILDIMGWTQLDITKNVKNRVGELGQKVLDKLDFATPIHIDNLRKSVNINMPELQTQLSLLELSGNCCMTQPGWYLKTK